MSTLPSPVDYTEKDYESILRRIQHLIGQVFEAWTDFNRGNFGNILLESYSHIGDIFTYYQDNQAGESKWGTAQQRVSIIESAKLIDYTLSSASAATSDLSISITRTVSPGGDVTFPQGTIFYTKDINDPQRFQLLSETIIASGDTTCVAAVEHSETSIFSSTTSGKSDEKFKLPIAPFLDDSETVTIDGDTWTSVDDFLDSTNTSKHYKVEVDQFDYAYIVIGDGINGVVPSEGSDINISYKYGGGEDGNVEVDTIVNVEGAPFYDEFGNIVTVSVTASTEASGGLNRETVEQAKSIAPRASRTMSATVSRVNYEDRAIQVNGVVRALMTTSNEDSGVSENQGKLYIVPAGGGTASSALLESVENYINNNYPPTLTFLLNIYSANYLTINIVVWVYFSSGYDPETVSDDIRENLRTFFSPLNSDNSINEQINFGYYFKDIDDVSDGELAYTTIEGIIKETTGVRRLGVTANSKGMTLNGTENNATLEINEFPEAGTIIIYNGDLTVSDPDYEVYNGAI